MTNSDLAFDYGAFGNGVRRMRELRGLTIRQLSDLADVSKETLRTVETGAPCSDRTREKLRRALNTSIQRLCLASPLSDAKIAVHGVDETAWIFSRDCRPSAKGADLEVYPPIYVESEAIQDGGERDRLGRLGFATRFLRLLNCDRPGGHVFAGIMEIYNRGDAKSHAGEEFAYCIRGNVRLLLDGSEYVISEGGAVTFDARLPHDYEPVEAVRAGELAPLMVYVRIDLPGVWLRDLSKTGSSPSSAFAKASADEPVPTRETRRDLRSASSSALPVSGTSASSDHGACHEPAVQKAKESNGEFDFEAFGRGVCRLRQVRGFSVRKLAQLAGVDKDTVRVVEAGAPCSERTREKLRRALKTCVQRLCFPVARPEDPISVYEPGQTEWFMSRDWRKLPGRRNPEDVPAVNVGGESLQSEKERCRLGRHRLASRFMLEFCCDLFWSPVAAGLMEVFNSTDPKTHPGEEFVYCLRGGIRLLLDGEAYELREGQAAAFDARIPHDYESIAPVREGERAPLALWVLVDI